MDKVVELTRFATPEPEARLVKWSRRVSVAAIRAEADRANAPEVEETRDTERARSLRWWWFDDNRALGLEGYFPAAQGAAIVAAIQRAAKEVPDTSEESGDHDFDTPSERRAVVQTRRLALQPGPGSAGAARGNSSPQEFLRRR